MATVISGTAGQDTLLATAGDTVLGSLGDDVVQVQGAGAVLTFGRGQGMDRVTRGSALGSFDVQVAAGVTPSDLELVWSADALSKALVLRFKDGSGELMLSAEMPITNTPTAAASGLRNLVFSDGTVISSDRLLSSLPTSNGSRLRVPAELTGTAGNDLLTVSAYNAHLVTGGQGADTIDSGANGLPSGSYAGLLGASDGGDTLAGGAGQDTYLIRAGWGKDTMTDNEGGNVIQLGAGLTPAAVQVRLDEQGSLLIERRVSEGGMVASWGDVLTIKGFAVTADSAAATVSSLVFDGGAGPAWSTSQILAEVLKGTAGADLVAGGVGNDQIDGLGGADQIAGGAGADTLLGGAGDDLLMGGAGDDVYDGGAGRDLLRDAQAYQAPVGPVIFVPGVGYIPSGDTRYKGIPSSDTYRFGRGSGHDTVVDIAYDSTSVDRVALGAGVSLDDLAFYKVTRTDVSLLGASDSTDLLVHIRGTDDVLDINGQYASSGLQGVEQFVFADGSTLSAAAAMAMATDLTNTGKNVPGTEGSDTQIAVGDKSTLLGSLGSDTYVLNPGPYQTVLLLNALDDLAAQGVDTVELGAGSAVGQLTVADGGNNVTLLTVGNGQEVVLRTNIPLSAWSAAQASQVVFKFADGGTRTLEDIQALRPATPVAPAAPVSPTYLRGTDGDDMISGKVVEAGRGDDVVSAPKVVYKPGDGYDQVYDQTYLIKGVGPAHFTGEVTVQLQGGIRPEDVLLSVGSDLADPPTVIRFKGMPGGLDVMGLSRVEFDNGDAWTSQDIQSYANLGVAPVALNLDRTTQGGNSTVLGSSRDDVVKLGAGNDRAEGGLGSDLILGNAGSDTLYGGYAQAYTFVSQYDDAAGHDTLIGGLGNDLVYGSGADVIRFAKGDGQDTVRMMSSDVLELGAGLTLADMLFSLGGTDPAVATDAVIGFKGLTDSIRLKDLNAEQRVQVKLADGTVLTGADVWQRSQTVNRVGTSKADTLVGTVGADTLSGLAGNDVLDGQAGNDSLDGGTGADTLVGGQGADTLLGGKGSDVYLFQQGCGRDVVIENESALLATDVARFEDAAANQLWFSKSGKDLVVSTLGTTDSVTIKDWYAGSNYRVERFEAGGKALTASRVDALVSAMSGFTMPTGTGGTAAVMPAVVDQLVTRNWR